MLLCAADYALKASHKTNRRQGARVEGEFFLAYLVLSLLLNEEGAWSISRYNGFLTNFQRLGYFYVLQSIF